MDNRFYVARIIFAAVLFLAVAVSGMRTYAQESASVTADTPNHYYDEVSMDRLSKLYWKLQKFDIEDDAAVDTYLMINECEIYTEYNYNELEWGGIRQNAKVFIKENVDTFPDRFKFVQPLRLGEYDAEKQVLNVQQLYEIDGIRKFEVFAKDFRGQVCTAKEGQRIKNYPAVLLIELTQPITLTSIPMTKPQAVEYINDKMRYVENVSPARRTKELVNSYRDAYIVMKIRVMSYKGEDSIENAIKRSIVYALLEGYEVYADREHTKLLYFQNYLRDDDEAKPVEAKLKEQYEALRKRRGVQDKKESGRIGAGSTDGVAVTSGQPAAGEVKAAPGVENTQPSAPQVQRVPDSDQDSNKGGQTVYDDLESLQQ